MAYKDIETWRKYAKKNRKRILSQHKDFYYRHKNRLKIEALSKRYHLTTDKYNEIFNKQNGCCAICGTHQSELRRALSVDHNHKCCPGRDSCGECVRGLLCDKCNFLMGHADDSLAILTSAIKYLEMWNELTPTKL